MHVHKISSGEVRAYRSHRMTSKKHPKTGEPLRPARSTMHQEIVTLRQVLKMCRDNGWIENVPSLAAPYRASGKISHRAWFSPDEYKQLYEATRARAETPRHPRWREQTELLHDLVLFLGNTGLRPDEAMRLEFRDVVVVLDESTNKRILEIEVRGKRGVGYCKSMPGAVHPFLRIQKRRLAAPTTKIFEPWPSELFKTVLTEQNLRFDRDGQLRSLYSLRHTYICLRLMEGADIYQVAKNCRTSVEMIEKYYASHLKNMLDASAINVRRDG
jgi:integrase